MNVPDTTQNEQLPQAKSFFCLDIFLPIQPEPGLTIISGRRAGATVLGYYRVRKDHVHLRDHRRARCFCVKAKKCEAKR